ncbi:hypothetical protein [Actinosynnema sp.]|uniref:hypothetical protein n=1 Tax=Actinosynnema sp. TaxID=1872144 RepID=UPI003F83BC14
MLNTSDIQKITKAVKDQAARDEQAYQFGLTYVTGERIDTALNKEIHGPAWGSPCEDREDARNQIGDYIGEGPMAVVEVATGKCWSAKDFS